MLIIFALTLLVYGIAARGRLFEQSDTPHYIELADAFWQGRVDIPNPSSTYDLIQVDNKWYLASPPGPAVLLMPIVGVLGTDMSDVLLSVLVGSFNVMMVHALFRRNWLTILFAFGTPHLYLSVLGEVWFFTQVVSVAFGLGALWFAWRRPWQRTGRANAQQLNAICAGALWGLSCVARPTVGFGLIFIIALLLGKESRSAWLKLGISFLAPIAVAGLLVGVYNNARFGSPTDFGYDKIQGANNLAVAINEYGSFHPHFLPCNVLSMLLLPPQFFGRISQTTLDACSHIVVGADMETDSWIRPNPLGMSLFLSIPALALLAWAQKRHLYVAGAWIGLFGVMVPLLLLHNTGSAQFGYRYWLDAAPMWLFLFATVLNRPNSRRTDPDLPVLEWIPNPKLGPRLILASIVINIWGFLWIYNLIVGKTWW